MWTSIINTVVYNTMDAINGHIDEPFNYALFTRKIKR